MNHKIMAVAMVKNEADIIETFVRYVCKFLDGMIVLDNRSTDGTLAILKNLAAEGLPLFILEDEEPGYYQAEKTSRLVQMAIDEHQADLVLPLDADEFPVAETGAANPREMLEALSHDTLHYMRWRIYIPHAGDDLTDPCIPRRIRYSRPITPADLRKVVIPAQLWQEWELRLTIGNHDALSRRYPQRRAPKSVIRDLKLAHFAVRTLEQIKAKAFVGWINCLAQHDRGPGESVHLKSMFSAMKQNRLDNENFSRFAKEYLSSFQKKEEFRPITWEGLTGLKLQYSGETDGEWLRKGLENMEALAAEARRFTLGEKPIQLEEINPEENRRKLLERQTELRRLQTSLSWRLTVPLRWFAELSRAWARLRS